MLTAEQIEKGEQFDPEKNWKDELIKTGTVLGLEDEQQNGNSDNNTTENDNENTTNNEENNANSNVNTINEQNTTSLILKDGDIVYARIYDGINGSEEYYTKEIKNNAKKTYTEKELAQIEYQVPTYDILAYEAKEDGLKVGIEQEITGIKQYDYYAKSSIEDEYKLISTSTNWNDKAEVTNEMLEKLGKDQLKANETYKVKVLMQTEAGKITQCLNTATIITKPQAEKETSYAENRTYIDENNYTAVIPAGFKVSGAEGENKISAGMVLKDSEGNEFVWVPVNQTKDIEGVTKVPTNTSSKVTYYKPMVKAQQSGNGYENTGYSYKNGKSYRALSSTYRIGTPYQREPTLITKNADDGYTWDVTTVKGTEYDASEQNYSETLGFSSVKEFGSYMNKEYTNMVNSTDKYNGFYIARYETSLNGDKAESKKGKTPMSEMTWYNMYYNQDSTRNSNNAYYSNTNVTTSMIWGAQYEAMLNWVLAGNEKSKLQATTYGNKSNMQKPTGSYENDKINNIYDLISNVSEFTQTGNGVLTRIAKGNTFEKSQNRNITEYMYPNLLSQGLGYGSRMAMYINNSSREVLPAIEITETTQTSNTITVKIKTTNNGAGISKYLYSISEDGVEWKTYEAYSQEYTYTKLLQNTTYQIKVQAEDKNGNMSIVKTGEATTEGSTLEEGAIYVKGIAGSSGKARLLLAVRDDYSAVGYTIEYQVKVADSTTVNDETGRVTEIDEKAKWKSGELITGLYENDEVYARLTDGTNYTGYITIKITNLETFSNTYSETQKYTDLTGKTAYIPAGFSVGTSETINKIDDGLVIQDEKGNQYVWIPVEEALAKNTTYPTSASSTSTYKPMAVYQDNSTRYYQSLIYDYSSTAKTYSYVNKNYKIGYVGYREPSLITGISYDGYTWDLESLENVSGNGYDVAYYSSILKFKSPTEYGKYKNEEYKNMIDSVEKYKGFYMARYETSVNASNKVQSQAEQEVLTAGIANTYSMIYYQDSNRNTQNPYYNSKSVTSSMMWNAQYDSMLNWMLQKSENKDQVFSTTLGNHKTATKADKSGVNMDDLTNNIFDLGGNVMETTQGSLASACYIARGGNFYKNYTYQGQYSMVQKYRQWQITKNTAYNVFGTRMALYLTKQQDTIPPTIALNSEPTTTTNSVYIRTDAIDENSGIKKYHYYISTDGTKYTENIGWGNSYTFEGLTPSTTYYIYATVEDKAGNVSEKTPVKEVQTNVIDAVDTILTPRIYGSEGDGRAYFAITDEYKNQGYSVEYQVVKQGSTFKENGTWTKSDSATAMGLSVGDMVYARAKDNTGNATNYRAVTITELEEFDDTLEAKATNKKEGVYYTYTDENGDVAYIPSGFSVGRTDSINKISTGLVVQDKDKNQYVWVPVNKDEVVYDGRNVKTDGTDTYKPMAQYQKGYNETTEQYFEGIQYNFNKNYKTGSKQQYVSSNKITNTLGTSNYREPTLVTGAANYSWVYQVSNNQCDALEEYYKGILGFNSATEFGIYMNEEYTNMIKSVKEYGGFYVGRYETSLKTGVVGSKINETTMDVSVGTETSSDKGNLWYGMYNKQDSNKNIRNPYYNSTTVVSSMIWGSQYDAMLNWALTGDEAYMVFERTGNNSGRVAKTGAYGSDIMNNIFDLSSNRRETTQCGNGIEKRVNYGGDYGSAFITGAKNATNPDSNSVLGSRLSLYIRTSN